MFIRKLGLFRQEIGVVSVYVILVLFILLPSIVGKDEVSGLIENQQLDSSVASLPKRNFTFSPKSKSDPKNNPIGAMTVKLVDLTKPLPPKQPTPKNKNTNSKQQKPQNIQKTQEEEFYESPEQIRDLHLPYTKKFSKQQNFQKNQPIQIQEQQQQQSNINLVPTGTVFILTLIMSLMSGLGAIPFYFMQNMSQKWAGVCNAMACGVMLAASFDLIHEGESYGPELVILGLILGAWFIRAIQQYLEQYEDVRFESLQGASARKVMLVVGIMAAHALGEGSGVGVSFCGNRGWAQGILVTFAIGVHNIPEGMAVATVMVAKGCTPNQALVWSTLTSLPQALLAVPSYIFVDQFKACLPLALGFAAGCMIWMVFAELLPDAVKDAGAASSATTATFAGACLEGFRMMLATLERPNGTLASPVQGDIHVVLPTLFSIFPVWIPPVFVSMLVATFLPKLGPSLLESSVAVQVTLASMSFMHLILFSQNQSIFTTIIFFSIGGLLVIAFWHNQVSKLNNNFSRNSSWGKLTDDVEQGQDEQQSNNGSVGSWEVLKNNSNNTSNTITNISNSNNNSINNNNIISNIGFSYQQKFGGDSNGGSPKSNGSQNLNLIDKQLIYTQQFKDTLSKELSRFKIVTKMGKGPYAELQSFLTVQIAGWTSFLAFISYQVSQGWSMAEVAVSSPFETSNQIMIPACFKAIPLGLAAAGLAPFVLGNGQRNMVIMAALIGVISPLMATLSILRYPLGESTPDEVAFDPNNWISKSMAAGSGAMLVSGLWGLWPLLQQMNLEMRYIGLVLGLFVTTVIQIVLGGLCLGTPYCMRVEQ